MFYDTLVLQAILTTSYFVRMIAAIILAVAAELLAYALEVLTRELLAAAGLVLRVAELALVATVAAIVVMIAQPVAIQTPSVVAGELILGARGRRRTVVQSHVLISPVNTVRISVAQPLLWDALSAVPQFVRGTSELGFFVALSVVWKLN